MANASILDETTALGETKRLVLVYIYALRRHNRALGTLDAVAPTGVEQASADRHRAQDDDAAERTGVEQASPAVDEPRAPAEDPWAPLTTADGHVYWYHTETHETTWERPSGVEIVPDETAAAKMAAEAKAKEAKAKEARERAFAEARADADVTTDALDALKKHTSVDVARVKLPGLKSWYYEDDSGNWQGPFAATELMAWRAMLPMELRLFEHGDEEAETTLANVLGDAPLLAQCAALGVVLPPRSTAAHAQAALREAKGSAALPEDEAEEEPRARNDWERAVMEGLPPERAIMSGADPAEVARKVIEKRAADLEASYASTGVYNTMLHRITDASTIAKSTSVYSDIGLDNYVDTTTLDAALHEMKNRKHVKLTPKQIARLKERKRKLKDKFNNEWLRRDD